MQVPKTHREVRPAYGVPEIGTISNGNRKRLRAPKARASCGVWGLIFC